MASGWAHCINKSGRQINVYSSATSTTVIAIIFPNERYVRGYSGVGYNPGYEDYPDDYIAMDWTSTVKLLNGSGDWVTGVVKSYNPADDMKELAFHGNYAIYKNSYGKHFRVRRQINIYKSDGVTKFGILPSGGRIAMTDSIGHAGATRPYNVLINYYYDAQIGIWKNVGSGWANCGFGYGAYESTMTIYTEKW